jgi:hypothetical protein
MAKQFAGFKREAMENKILPALGYTGSMDPKMINAFLASNPRAAAKMGRYTLAARQRIEGTKGFNAGALALSPGAQPPEMFDYSGLGRQMTMDEFSRSDKRGVTTNEYRAPVDYLDPSTGQTTKLDPALIGQYEDYSKGYGQPEVNPTSATDRGIADTVKFRQALDAGREREASIQPNTSMPDSPERDPTLVEYELGIEAVNAAQKTLTAAQKMYSDNPESESAKQAMDNAQIALTQAQAASSGQTANLGRSTEPAGVTAKSLIEPETLVTKADVETVSDEQKTEGKIDAGTGQVSDPEMATGTTADSAPDVVAPKEMTAKKYEPKTVTPAVKSTLDKLEAATGKPSDEALAEAATMKPGDLARLGLTVEQIDEARKVVAPAKRKLEEGELIEGSTVDMDRVKKTVNFEAATGAPSTDATVAGQLTGLMEQFEGNEPPAFAAGAIRAAAAQMAARGLSASSMAGQAIIQAAMESALPIAQQDAATFARFESQNLSNKQQAAMFAAEKRAEFLNLEFTQEFQTRVSNAAKVSDIANMNFSADVQIALENARMAQTVDLANLDAKNAKIMADAAAMTNVDMANLNNRQQTAIQNANAFLNMDMKNLDNEQQTAMFKTQELVNSMLSDQAATNAAAQFNATSEMQTEQFFASLTSTIARFNSEQANAMSRFNAGEANSLAQFNALQNNAADQFNAKNHLIVAQANAQWFQNITTTDNAANNQSNRDSVLAANNLTMTAYNNIVQRERDLLAWAWQTAENAAQRDSDILTAKINAQEPADANATDNFSKAAGSFLTKLAMNAADKFFS